MKNLQQEMGVLFFLLRNVIDITVLNEVELRLVDPVVIKEDDVIELLEVADFRRGLVAKCEAEKEDVLIEVVVYFFIIMKANFER